MFYGFASEFDQSLRLRLRVHQGIKTRTSKVVPLKFLLHILLKRPLYFLQDLEKGSPKPKGTTLRVQGIVPRV